MKKHKKSWHEVISYPCEQCKYIGNTSKKWKHHTDSKHEGIRYPCNECEFGATSLKKPEKAQGV